MAQVGYIIKIKNMNNCTKCGEVEVICNTSKPCGCPIPDLSTDCVKYDGPDLECSGIATPNTLTQIIKKIDEFICSKFESTFIGELLNIGGGVELYKQTNDLTGRQEVRTLESSDNSITITQLDNTINFTLTEGAGEDKYVNNITLSGNNIVIGFNIGEDLSIDMSPLNTDNFLSEDPTFDRETGILSFQMEGGEVRTVNISELQQTQSNVLELDNTSPAFIKNQNPQKVITTNYTLTPDDNNYVILADTSNGDIVITIDMSTPATELPSNYFVGFLQKGMGEVSFAGYDIKPDQYTDTIQGNGHNAAIEVFDVGFGVKQVNLTGSLNEIV